MLRFKHFASRNSCVACVQVEALTNTLAQMQATNNAFSASLRQDDVTPEQQRALRCGVMGCAIGVLVVLVQCCCALPMKQHAVAHHHHAHDATDMIFKLWHISGLFGSFVDTMLRQVHMRWWWLQLCPHSPQPPPRPPPPHHPLNPGTSLMQAMISSRHCGSRRQPCLLSCRRNRPPPAAAQTSWQGCRLKWMRQHTKWYVILRHCIALGLVRCQDMTNLCDGVSVRS